MTRVLAFGDDHSAEADLCWSWIIGQSWDGWSLEVVTADPREDMRPVDSDESGLHEWEPDSPRDAGDSGFDSVVYLHAEMDPRVALMAKPWDLVAIGPRGSGLLKRLHLGSASDWLLREPASPLLIAREAGPVRRVLFAADGSSHARLALDCLLSLPWITATAVHVVAVDDGEVEAEDVAEQAESLLSAAGVETTKTIRRGRAAHEILEESKSVAPDLVAMGVRGDGGLKDLVLGSTASAMASSTDFSLLVAHAEDGQSG
jgi:nucleotide-binding universal stress UspA family protein